MDLKYLPKGVTALKAGGLNDLPDFQITLFLQFQSFPHAL